MGAEPYSAAPPASLRDAFALLRAITALRIRYLRSGYTPLPCIGKVPALANWPGVRITVDLIKTWALTHRGALNTGIRCTQTPAIDIDVSDAAVIERIEAALLKHVPPDKIALRRVGRAPRVLIPFVSLKQIRKRSVTFRSPDETIHKVDILGHGQQFIAEGWHPDTGAPYEWRGDKLVDVLPTRLPPMDAALADQFLADARAIMAAQGWVEASASNGAGIEAGEATKPPTGGNGASPGEPADSTYARAALERECEAVAAALEGTRNDALNRAAYNLFQLVAGGELDADEVTQRLTEAAAECGLGEDDGEMSVKKTIASGGKAGQREPRRAPTWDDEDAARVDESAEPKRAACDADEEERFPGDRQAQTVPDQRGQQNGKQVRGPNTCPRQVTLVHAHTIEQRPIEWLWKPRLARGKITLFAGDPGVGKSALTADIVARATTAKAWPDCGFAPLGNCIVLSAEDAADDTICPRLDVAGANMSRVFLMRMTGKSGARLRTFSLGQDLPLLATAVENLGDVILIAIDPVTAYLGDKIDTHQTAAVRAVLEPLDDFAASHRVAILGITHPPKAAQSKAINAFTGSLAFVAAARTAFVAIEEPETDRRLLLAVKSNIGPTASGIAYRLVPTQTGNGIETIRVEWDGDPVDITANEALHAAAEEARNSGSQKREAKEFLETLLAAGPKRADEVTAAAEANDIAPRTLARAKKELRIVSEKDDFLGHWTWRLPR
jgi:AAA domain/Bifunctional DNA primase/polymerase, N-terminal